jgi:FADH2 O2-dependent halogenase
MRKRADVAIIGSGFSGSVLAWILAKQGMRVTLIDATTHPRFAIGESSTPIADMLLRRLGQTYQISELESLSTWATWQQDHPDLACGRKRGFSYYRHTRGEPFREPREGDRSLLVAASPNDSLADTHWYRQDVDQFFFARAIQAGASDLTDHRVVAHEVLSDSKFTIDCQGEKLVTVESEWVIDASGQAGVLAKLTGVADLTDQLRTHTHCVYGHYANVGSWTEHLRQSGIETANDPFNADDAAQHHLLESGWLWMLRFNNAITSVGWTAPISTKPASSDLDWSAYPSLASLFHDAELVGPDGGLRRSRRLQRLLDPVIDDRRIMLPTAAVTIDPLHSTGIAHALAGVERVARIISESDSRERVAMVGRYRQAVLDETSMLDQLVSTAYETMDDFPRFTAACMLYFAGAIRCEERYQRGETPTQLWNADEAEFVEFVKWASEKLVDRESGEFQDEIRQRLQPWNTAGLMDRAVANRYAYTATK